MSEAAPRWEPSTVGEILEAYLTGAGPYGDEDDGAGYEIMMKAAPKEGSAVGGAVEPNAARSGGPIAPSVAAGRSGDSHGRATPPNPPVPANQVPAPAMGTFIRVTKPRKETALGIGIQARAGWIAVTSVSDTSLFAGTPLRVGMILLRINRKRYSTFREGAAMMLEAQGTLTVLASTHVDACMRGKSPFVQKYTPTNAVRGITCRPSGNWVSLHSLCSA